MGRRISTQICDLGGEVQEQEQIIVLLSGGDKSSQQDDIVKAVALAKAYLELQQGDDDDK